MPLPEKQLIEQIRRLARQWAASAEVDKRRRIQNSPTRSGVASLLQGIADDSAILRVPAAHEVLVTTDFSLEGVHFRRQWHPPESVGHRCLARGLSDIAAMGGAPVAAFLSLALPPDLPQRWVTAFVRGFLSLARRYGVPLAGGDTAQSPAGVLADIVVLGSVPRGKAVLRSGARAGDRLYVSGQLGASSVTLTKLRRKGKLNAKQYPAHFFPQPRLDIGRILREKKLASAMIDLSDGLSTDLHHICAESRVGARIYADRIPVAGGETNLQFALHGGEDYELLFTAPARKQVPPRIAGVPITQVGEITRRRGVVLVQGGKRIPLPAAGWEHFRGAR